MKLDQYKKLVAERKNCQQCMRTTEDQNKDDSRYLTNPSDVAKIGCDCDSNQIGPWTQWQGNLDADLMVVGQDWGDTKYFKDNKGREKANNPTNRMLIKLMSSIDRRIENPEDVNQPKVAFFTNAILCLKQGNMQTVVQEAWFRNCQHFLRQQIEIVKPKIVVGLGQLAYNTILSAFAIKKPAKFLDSVTNTEGVALANGSRAFAVYHCGARILNTHRRETEQFNDWQRIGEALPAIPSISR